MSTEEPLRFPTEEEWAIELAVNMYGMDPHNPNEGVLVGVRQHIAGCGVCEEVLAGKREEYRQW